MTEIAVLLLAVAVAALLVAAAVQRLVERVTVFEYERALRYDAGRFTDVVGPGRYWRFRPRTRLVKIDVRPRLDVVPGQEVITADGVSVRVTLVAEYAVTDPATAINEHAEYEQKLYTALQVGLRRVVSETPIDDLLEQRSEIGARVAGLVAEDVRAIGVELHAVEARDFMFSGDLRRTFAQVVAARKEGLAALERARGESAALRNLANAARMMEGNPALMHLRLLQELGRSAGNTIVLGLPGSTTPLPVRGAPPEPAEGAQAELPPTDE